MTLDDPRGRSRRGATLVLLGLACALTTLAAVRTTPFRPSASCCDHLFYRSIAYNLITVTRPELNAWPPGLDLTRLYQDPYQARFLKVENRFNRQPPYCYRIVTPLLARAIAYPLGDNINRGFYVLSFTALALACFWMARVVLELTDDLLPAIGAAVSFASVFRLTRYHLSNYMLTDPLAFLFSALGVWLMLRRADRWFYVVSLVAIFNKETHVFLMASYALMQLTERRLTRGAVAAYGAILVSYLAFRLLLPVPNNTYHLRALFLGLPDVRAVIKAILAVFGVLALFGVSRAWRVRFAWWLLPLVAGAFVTSLIAVDTERAYVYAFPVVLLAVFGWRVEGLVGRLLVSSPALLFVLVTFAQERMTGVTDRDWYLLDVALWALVEGALLLVVTERGTLLRRRVWGSDRVDEGPERVAASRS